MTAQVTGLEPSLASESGANPRQSNAQPASVTTTLKYARPRDCDEYWDDREDARMERRLREDERLDGRREL